MNEKWQWIGPNLALRNGRVVGRIRVKGVLRIVASPWQDEAALTRTGQPTKQLLRWLHTWEAQEREDAETRARDPDAAPLGRVPTAEDLIEAYCRIGATRAANTGRLTLGTVRGNASKVRTLWKQAGLSMSQPIDQATPQRIEAWSQSRVEASEDAAAERYACARLVGQAASCWAQWTREPYRRLGLRIPACLDRWPTIEGTAPVYQDPPEPLKRATLAGGAVLELEDQECWLAYALMIWTGMRPGDVRRARWDWFREQASGGPRLQFAPEKTAGRTRGRMVDQIVSPDLWRRMLAARGSDPRETILPAAGAAAALERLNGRMRAWGWTVDRYAKASYELRKLFVSAVYNSRGLAWAAQYSGDNPTTIQTYYCAAYRRDAPSLEIESIIMGSAA
jgi:hypothetical protein